MELLLASQMDFLSMEVKPFRFHKTESANNHVKQGDALFLADHPIDITYDLFSAVLANTFHDFCRAQGTCHKLTTAKRG